MANNDSIRTCPKCGMNLGQRHLCPVCDKTEENTEPASNPAADAARIPEPILACEYKVQVQYSQTADYVSRVIEFIGEHPNDWDNEFNTFFDGLPEEHEYMACHDECSKVNGIFQIDMLFTLKISGSMTINAMNELKTIFPFLSDKEARGFALNLLQKRMKAFFATPPSGSKAMELYRKALEQNDADAQHDLGYCYSDDFIIDRKGVRQNAKEAVKWYRLAAEQGHAKAQLSLGHAYLYGKGVSKDKAEAVKWYRKAAEQGNEDARKRLKELGQ
jgi:tetratricopeptide (TPR) repeat protein